MRKCLCAQHICRFTWIMAKGVINQVNLCVRILASIGNSYYSILTTR
jgi:hypothetical protein